jgi:hypothetical protein
LSRSKVKTPRPTLVSPRTPVPSSKTPAKRELLLLFPKVNIAVVAAAVIIVVSGLPFDTIPVPASEPMELLKPFRSRVESTVKAEFGLNAVVEAACSVPVSTDVAPV